MTEVHSRVKNIIQRDLNHMKVLMKDNNEFITNLALDIEAEYVKIQEDLQNSIRAECAEQVSRFKKEYESKLAMKSEQIEELKNRANKYKDMLNTGADKKTFGEETSS